MKDIRPMWSTTVDPSEYDVDGQMEDFVKAANKAKECYYGIDVGKLWGLYKAFKSQSDELTTLRAQLAEARELIAEAKVEIGFTLTGLTQPSNSTYNKLSNYLKKVITA